jgi:bisphosphoglycerate-dependent phosphoglycerate mutase
VKGTKQINPKNSFFYLFLTSEWNQKNLFCGWFDSDLSEKGLTEAKQAGKVRLYKKQTIHNCVFIFLVA